MSVRRHISTLALASVWLLARGSAAQWEPPALETAEDAPEVVRVEMFAGAGVGTRALRRPTIDGEQRLDTTAFPALAAGMRVRAWPEARISLQAQLHYETSVGFTVEEQPLFALATDVDVRAERVELSAAPVLQLCAAQDALALAFPLGVTLRSFVAEDHEVSTPTYALAGPLVRAELVAALTPLLRLSIGPEAAFLLVMSDDVRDAGVSSAGYALGAEATLSLPFSPAFTLELNLRESHAIVPGKGDRRDLNDVERFVIGRLTGAL